MNPSPTPAPFTSAHTRATITKTLLIVGALISGLMLVTETLTFPFPLPTEDAELGDNVIGTVLAVLLVLIGLLAFVVYVTTVVFFLMWLYRANNNLKRFNQWARLEYSAGWAVGSFFVPFANLIVPYRAVREVWQKSGTPDEAIYAEPSPPGFFPVWWVVWLFSGFLDNISFRLSFNENVPESTAMTVSIVANGLGIIAAALAYFVVDAIDKRQEETSAKLRLGQLSGPPPPPQDLGTSIAFNPDPQSPRFD